MFCQAGLAMYAKLAISLWPSDHHGSVGSPMNVAPRVLAISPMDSEGVQNQGCAFVEDSVSVLVGQEGLQFDSKGAFDELQELALHLRSVSEAHRMVSQGFVLMP